jgi:hypothetical protein
VVPRVTALGRAGVERTAERFLACLGYKQRLGSIVLQQVPAAART